MTIAKPKALSPDSFVAAAPDAKSTRWQRGTRTQITLSIAPELLDRVDEVAQRKHLSRAALMTTVLNDWLDAMDARAAA